MLLRSGTSGSRGGGDGLFYGGPGGCVTASTGAEVALLSVLVGGVTLPLAVLAPLVPHERTVAVRGAVLLAAAGTLSVLCVAVGLTVSALATAAACLCFAAAHASVVSVCPAFGAPRLASYPRTHLHRQIPAVEGGGEGLTGDRELYGRVGEVWVTCWESVYSYDSLWFQLVQQLVVCCVHKGVTGNDALDCV